VIETWPKAKKIAALKKHKNDLYELIQDCHNIEGWSIEWMCEYLKISRSSYYKWLHRSATSLDIENEKILNCIADIAQSNNQLFGVYKMMYSVNKRLNSSYNHKRIYRLMCVNDYESVFRKEKRYRWKRSTPEITAENVLNREFEVSKPNEVWCTDVTELVYPGIAQKAYISTYIDLYDRSIPGLAVSKHNDSNLCNEALDNAIQANPGASPLHHSDRGFAYTRAPFKTILEEHGMEQSMSRVSRCIDNGPCESFQGIIKDILFVMHPDLKTYEELEEAIYKTYDYYQNEYPQTRFKGKTAMEVRNEALSLEMPMTYPIKPNPRVTKYWKGIEELKQKHKENQAA